jgi:ubiquinone/menaquinone biosynthesis C-methylase UbiE
MEARIPGSLAATGEDSVTYDHDMSLDEANAQYWDELCGTSLARSLGISKHTPAELERFDRAYLDTLYPYLTRYVDWLGPEDLTVLEVGTGYGTLGRLLLDRGADYYAVDIAEGPVQMAASSLERHGQSPAHAVRASVLELPFAAATFDAAAAIGSLHHTGDVSRAVAEIKRVLKPGGRAIVMLYNGRSLNRVVTVPIARAAARIAPSKRDWLLYRIERDLNEAFEGAPHTDFFTKTQALALFDSWHASTVRSENANGVTIFGHSIVPRRLLLPIVGPTLGLDLYIRAVA